MPTPNPNAAPLDAPTGAAWVSARDAAAALGVSEKTVWRRARAGDLIARKVTGARGALVWEIALGPTGQTNRPTGQTNRPTGQEQPANRPKAPDSERKPGGQPDKPTGQIDDGAAPALDDTGARFMAHLEAENKFLRAALEQRDRDAAELRAALRAALKLTAGDATPQLTAGDSADGARAGAASGVVASAPDREQIETLDPATARGSSAAPLTYGDIADGLERDLKARGL